MTESDGPDDGTADAETLRHTYDWDTTRPSAAVVELVAIAADRDPMSLAPLFEAVDPEALDTLVRRDGDVRSAEDTRIRLRYAGHDVTVRSDGEVSVTPAAAEGHEA